MKQKSSVEPSKLPVGHCGGRFTRPGFQHLLALLALAPPAPVQAAEYEVKTIAGVVNGDKYLDGPPGVAQFPSPFAIAADPGGNLLVSEGGFKLIRKISPDGNTSTLRDGNGNPVGSALIRYASGIAADAAGNVYVIESIGGIVYRVATGGTMTAVVGAGAGIQFAESLTLDPDGNLFIADTTHHVIRKRTPDGVVSVFAGTFGALGSADGPAGVAKFLYPHLVVSDQKGNLYVGDDKPAIRKISPAGVTSTLVGDFSQAVYLDGPKASARLNNRPYGLGAFPNGDVFFGDGESTLRKVSAQGVVSTVAGRRGVSVTKDGVGTNATFAGCTAMSAGTDGFLYFLTGDRTFHRMSVGGDGSQVGSPPAELASLNLGTTVDLTGVSFRNAYSGAAVGASGQAYFTGNGGQTWTPSVTGVTNGLNSVRLVDSVGFIAGSGGLLCISTNNGSSWRPFATGTTATFNDLSFTSSTAGWAVGSAGTICRYNGRAWIPTPTDLAVDFRAVSAVDSGVAFAVGSAGTICRYNGTRWVTQTTGTTVDFFGVAFASESFGIAVGSRGTICRYNGTTWTALISGIDSDLRSVSVLDPLNILVSGDGGVLLESSDGGVTWLRRSVGTANVFGLNFRGGRGYLVGSRGAAFSFSSAAQPLNQPPSIRLVQPVNGESFSACDRIPIRAFATDPDGTISRVEFFRGEFPLAEITRAPRNGQPYTTSYHTDAVGPYVLRAVATDNLGATSVSEPVEINVIAPPLHLAIAEEWTATNGFTLCFRGVSDARYILQRRDRLSPDSEWVNLQTNVMPEPFLRTTDSTATNLPLRYYRFVPAQ